MRHGYFHGSGMLLYDDIVIYAGNWERGNTTSNAKEMVGCIDMHPGELLQLYLYREMVQIRKTFSTNSYPYGTIELSFHSNLQKNTITVDVEDDISIFQRVHGITDDLVNYISESDIQDSQEWIPVVATCYRGGYIRLGRKTLSAPVHAYLSPNETWFEDNTYDWYLFAEGSNDYSMLQDILHVRNCVALAYIGAGRKFNKNCSIVTEYIRVFTHLNEKYRNCCGIPFTLQTEWVQNNLDRFEVLARINPNQCIDLMKTVEGDRNHCKVIRDQTGWLYEPGSDDSVMKFLLGRQAEGSYIIRPQQNSRHKFGAGHVSRWSQAQVLRFVQHERG